MTSPGIAGLDCKASRYKEPCSMSERSTPRREALAAEDATNLAASPGTAHESLRRRLPTPAFDRKERALARSARRDPDQAGERLRQLHARHLDQSSEAKIRRALTPAEVVGALRLVHDVYVEEGYMEPHPLGMRVLLPYHALPGTTVFVAEKGNEIVGTVSLIADGPARLPIDELYPAFVDRLRRGKRRVAECSSLAVTAPFRGGLVVMHLIRGLLRWGMRSGLDDLLMAVHPKHEPFYRHVLLFELLGGRRCYGDVNGAPAIGLHLDLKAAPEIWQLFYGPLAPERNLYRFLCDPPRGTAPW